jgi:hypothetical protein
VLSAAELDHPSSSRDEWLGEALTRAQDAPAERRIDLETKVMVSEQAAA